MFLQDFIVVERPYPEVVQALTADPAGILGDSTSTACEEAERLYAKVGPANTPPLLRKAVVVEVGPIRRSNDTTLVAFIWTARGAHPGVFPRLDADLEIVPFGMSGTELTVRGRYEPPGGALGRRLDRLLLHRVAESTVRAFLADIAGRMEPATIVLAASPTDQA